jgi:LysM repeat protein
MKRLLFVLFSFPFLLFAQNKPLVIEGVAPALYVSHTVAPKENYYSIGRIYNISPKEIAPFNSLEMEKGLSLNQVIKIPLSQSNFLQEGNAGPDEVLVPVYHTTQGKEALARLSTNYNKVPTQAIMKWNKLKTETVPSGTKLIVGFLKVKKDLSPLAANAATKPAEVFAKTETAAKPLAEKVVEKTEATPPKALPAPPTDKEITAETEKKPTTQMVVKTVEPAKRSGARKNFNGGFFKTDYDKQVKTREVLAETGEAATFKSTSGWEDGKYYCLHNNSTPGTIIKITNSSTGKNIYAKVLDMIPDMKQNEGLVIRLSNAAADELGTGETRFNCTLSYSK